MPRHDLSEAVTRLGKRHGVTRPIRSPNKAELALLRWLHAEPRPVNMGPIGQCVKRGWCKPAFKYVVEDGLYKTVAIYFVTDLGRQFFEILDGDSPAVQPAPKRSGRPARACALDHAPSLGRAETTAGDTGSAMKRRDLDTNAPRLSARASPPADAFSADVRVAARNVLAKSYYMTHGIREGVQPLCGPKQNGTTAAAARSRDVESQNKIRNPEIDSSASDRRTSFIN